MKKMTILASALLLSAIFSGCASSSSPSTPQDVREAVGSGMFSIKKDSFTVNRPYNQVVSLLQRNSKKCLNKTFKHTSTTHNGYYMQTSTDTMYYKTKFKKGRTLSTLEVKGDSDSLQSGMTSAIYGEAYKDGYFIAVVDLHRKGSGKTQVDIYRASMLMGVQEDIVNAIKSWAKTGSRSCPNIAP